LGEEDDDDATIRIVRPTVARPRPGRPARLVAASAVVVLLLASTLGWALYLRPSPQDVAPPAPISRPSPHASTPASPAPVQPAPLPTAQPETPPRRSNADPPRADESEILAAEGPSTRVFRFQRAPQILVISFGSLLEQGNALNRLGAFIEKAGLPRDRVLDNSQLAAAIRDSGDTTESYYYGHDYRAADLARFFQTAARDGIVLRPEELWVRTLLDELGLLTPGAVGALISIPPESVNPPIDAASRATILQHELSHGLYFTDEDYARFARGFWRNTLSDPQRASFRRFLSRQGYDSTNEDLMLNETQAYLIHTPDARYFRPALVGMSEAEAARLRAIFVRGMPDSWLAEKTAAPRP
jgi:hypothetical protein